MAVAELREILAETAIKAPTTALEIAGENAASLQILKDQDEELQEMEAATRLFEENHQEAISVRRLLLLEARKVQAATVATVFQGYRF